MRKILQIALLLSFAAAVVSCDFFRRVAGRPVSSDIARKAAAIAARDSSIAEIKRQEEAAFQAEFSDSVAVLEALVQRPSVLKPSSGLNLKDRESLPPYCVIVGLFSNVSNADRLSEKISTAGFNTVLVPYDGKLTAVAVNPCSSVVDAYHTLEKLLEKGLCPSDSWILDNSDTAL